MDYVLMGTYGSFLAEQSMEDARLERYIDECILIAEGNATKRNIDILNEAIIDKAKNLLTKVLNIIKGLWKRFIEATDTLVQSTKNYLDKYRDIILKKKAPDVTYRMYNYPAGLITMKDAYVPTFNYTAMEKYLDPEDTDKFTNTYAPFKDCKQPNSDSTLAEQYKFTFRNGKGNGQEMMDIRATDLNMKDIFNYCYNYSNIKNQLSKDLSTIDKAVQDGLNIIAKREKDANGGLKPATDKQKQDAKDAVNKAKEQLQKDEQEMKNKQKKDNKDTTLIANDENVVYSHVYESWFVNEVETVNGGGGSTVDNNKGNTFKAANKNIETVSKTQANVNKAVDNATLTSVEGEADLITKKINVYLNASKEFLGAKQTVCEEIFKDYMDIIKKHVRYYVGKQNELENKTSDRPEQQGTNYKSGQE